MANEIPAGKKPPLIIRLLTRLHLAYIPKGKLCFMIATDPKTQQINIHMLSPITPNYIREVIAEINKAYGQSNPVFRGREKKNKRWNR